MNLIKLVQKEKQAPHNFTVSSTEVIQQRMGASRVIQEALQKLFPRDLTDGAIFNFTAEDIDSSSFCFLNSSMQFRNLISTHINVNNLDDFLAKYSNKRLNRLPPEAFVQLFDLQSQTAIFHELMHGVLSKMYPQFNFLPLVESDEDLNRFILQLGHNEKVRDDLFTKFIQTPLAKPSSYQMAVKLNRDFYNYFLFSDQYGQRSSQDTFIFDYFSFVQEYWIRLLEVKNDMVNKINHPQNFIYLNHKTYSSSKQIIDEIIQFYSQRVVLPDCYVLEELSSFTWNGVKSIDSFIDNKVKPLLDSQAVSELWLDFQFCQLFAEL